MIDDVTEVHARDLTHYAWTGLRQFQNVAYTSREIFEYQQAPTNQRKNVTKQAEQIRYCLFQGEEYFRAAKLVSLATKPLLLYYGLMSLALAEILIKQSGDSSLDRARGEHAHHGLQLRIDGNPSLAEELSDSASRLRAAPLVKAASQRFGTFELWHRSAREAPLCGNVKRVLHPGGFEGGLEIVATGSDKRMRPIPEAGVSLLWCLQSLPGMRQVLGQRGVTSNFARGLVKVEVDAQRDTVKHTTIIHPGNPDILETVYQRFEYAPDVTPFVSITEMNSGCIISVQQPPMSPTGSSRCPQGMQIHGGMIYFCADNDILNEFGVMYAGMYILGNYARYFPDLWMVDVERSPSLALAASEFISLTEDRAPLLILSELTKVMHLLPTMHYS